MNRLIAYIKSIFPETDDNTIATIVVTLTIFILGYLIKWVINFLVLEIRKSEIRSDFKTILSSISNSVYQQHLSFDTFCKTISLDKVGHHLTRRPIHHLDTINEYSYKEIRAAYLSILWFWKRRLIRQSVNSLYNRIGGLSMLEKNYPSDLSEFFNRINKYEAHWNENIEAQRDLFDRAFRETEGWKVAEMTPEELEYTAYLKEVDRIRVNWISQGADMRLNYTIVSELLINPLLNLGRTSSLRHDIVLKSFNYLLGANYAFENLRVAFDEMKLSFESYRDQYGEVSRLLKRSPLIN